MRHAGGAGRARVKQATIKYYLRKGRHMVSARKQARPNTHPFPYTEGGASCIQPNGAATYVATAIALSHQQFTLTEAFIHGIHPTLVLVHHVVLANIPASKAAVRAPDHHGEHYSEREEEAIAYN